ncbi:MAG: DNA mismatch repair endonuclease MutL [Bdellovibrionales bacterium]|nr:DNA mismatch repair endonuclease MutL [Bdellovibrionales bacterium]
MNKTSLIQTLDSSVIDQIAAGEVVERPAHLVKELIENSLDAGASSIEVQFAEGGLYVSVKDNGRGISPKELSLALSRHATSKIRQSSDLFSIQTYGFRGEALASIAGVSHLTLRSKSKESDQAYSVKSQFGKTLKVETTGGEAGTTVVVDRLFENVPARLRFLKSESVENLAIKNVITAQALSRPEVSFRVIHKGRLLFFWPAVSSYLKRAEMILSKPLHHHVYTKAPWSVELILAPPNRTAKSSKKMWFFVNGRSVEDKILYGAVMSAHRNLLMHGEYPIVVLHVTSPPAEVDVNIHPTKTQIRFLSQSRVFQLVQGTVRELLEKAPWLDLLHSESSDVSSKASSAEVKPEQTSFNPLLSTHKPSSKRLKVSSPLKGFDFTENSPKDIEKSTLEKTSYVVKNSETSSTVEKPEQLTSDILKNNFSSLKVLAQAHQTYLVTESSKSIVLIDQHAAHERILFEKFMSQLKNLEKQKHLIPLKIGLDPAEVKAVLSMKAEFQSLGIDLKSSKSTEISVLASPPFIKEKAIAVAIQQLAEGHIHHGEEFTAEKVVSEISATFACHSAIRAGQTLSLSEMKSLLSQMDEFAFSSFCPHGRPVFVEYPFSRIEREFGRIC